jgi:TrpR-related protein YerC/YecD
VDPSRPGSREALDKVEWCAGTDGDATEVASFEPHRLGAENVDCRNHFELLCQRVSMLTCCNVATDEPSHPWVTDEIEDLCLTIASLRSVDEVERFLRDLCTLPELETMAHRWEVAKLLDEGLSYLAVSERTGASTTTVTRVALWLRRGEGGYRLALDRARRRSRTR